MLALVTSTLALVASKHSLQPTLKLRGGLGSVDSAAVAKGASYLLVANGVLCGLGSDKACEGYGLEKPSFTTGEIVKSLGYVQGSMAILGLTTLAGMATPKAIAWSAVPLVLQTIENLLNDVPAKMGMPAGGMALLLAINSIAAYCGFNGVGPEWIFKAFTAWSMANGAFFALSPKAGAKAPSKPALDASQPMSKSKQKVLLKQQAKAARLAQRAVEEEKDPSKKPKDQVKKGYAPPLPSEPTAKDVVSYGPDNIPLAAMAANALASGPLTFACDDTMKGQKPFFSLDGTVVHGAVACAKYAASSKLTGLDTADRKSVV